MQVAFSDTTRMCQNIPKRHGTERLILPDVTYGACSEHPLYIHSYLTLRRQNYTHGAQTSTLACVAVGQRKVATLDYSVDLFDNKALLPGRAARQAWIQRLCFPYPKGPKYPNMEYLEYLYQGIAIMVLGRPS